MRKRLCYIHRESMLNGSYAKITSESNDGQQKDGTAKEFFYASFEGKKS